MAAHYNKRRKSYSLSPALPCRRMVRDVDVEGAVMEDVGMVEGTAEVVAAVEAEAGAHQDRPDCHRVNSRHPRHHHTSRQYRKNQPTTTRHLMMMRAMKRQLERLLNQI